MKYYHFCFTNGYGTYGAALDMHPFEYMKQMFERGETFRVLSFHEITKEEYDLFIDACNNMPI